MTKKNKPEAQQNANLHDDNTSKQSNPPPPETPPTAEAKLTESARGAETDGAANGSQGNRVGVSGENGNAGGAGSGNVINNENVSNNVIAQPIFAQHSMAKYLSFVFLLAVIGLVGVIFYWVMARFLIPLFLAALLVVIFRPVHQWILDRIGGRQQLAAALTTAAVLLAVLVPFATLTVVAVAEGRQMLKQFNAAKILSDTQETRSRLGLDLPHADEIRLIDDQLTSMQLTPVLSQDELSKQGISIYEITAATKLIGQAQSILPSFDSVSLVLTKNELPTAAGATDDTAPASDLKPNQSNAPGSGAASNEQTAVDDEPAAGDPAVDSSPAASPNGTDPRVIAWKEYCLGLKGIRDLRKRLLEQDSDSDDFSRSLHDYQQGLLAVQQSFARFKVALLGGSTRAFAVELLNPTEEELSDYATRGQEFLKQQVLKFGGFAGSLLGSLLIGGFIMVISLYFFLLDGPAMLESLKGLSPLDDEHEQELVTEFGHVSRAVVLATLGSALAQGLLAGIGFYFVGLDAIFLLTLLSVVLAMVPFLGAAAVWVPCTLYLYFVENNIVGAIGLGLYGMLVISMADNIIKPYILHGQSNLHPLLALLSVIGGVAALGPIGILIGPMVVVFLQTLLEILQRELTGFEAQ